MATKGTAKTTGVYNITNLLKEKGLAVYKEAQGCTVSTGNAPVYVFTALQNAIDKETKNALIGCVKNGKLVAWHQECMGHANDCAYYDNKYYVAQGSDRTKKTEIKEYSSDLKTVTKYNYKGDLDRITYITYMQHGYFIMGCGNHVAICRRDVKAKTFVEETSFDLNEGSLKQNGYEKARQGACYADGSLYRVYSYKDSNNIIKKNAIAEYKLNGPSPAYYGASLKNVYSCEIPGKKFFEVESIFTPDYGDHMYVSANVKDGNGTEADRIYSVSFS